jgi:signal recognition particle receptor subunit beta
MTELRVVATAGHVDHGKSSLIVRLTGIDPDRWEEEKRRGLTIDLGFAWTTLPSGREIGFVDVPGHERFVRNMLAGVGPVRLILFVVAADEGWKPQSEEHLEIVDVLGAHAGVVALTKSDLVDEAALAVRTEEIRGRVAGTALRTFQTSSSSAWALVRSAQANPDWMMNDGTIAPGARDSVTEAKRLGCNVVIVDTAGRTNIDDVLMQQATDIKTALVPAETLFVIDSMIGQEAVTVAKAFQEAVDFTGVILSKLDGDARGGAALSVAEVTGRPIKFASIGEKLDEFEAFHPDRMAGRILGMGDVLTLIEKAEEVYTEEQAADMQDKLLRAEFNLEDFLDQMQQVKQMGPLQGLLGMIPGVAKQLKDVDIDDSQITKVESIIQSMTLEERRNPDILNGKRKKRIARGSGRSAQEINELLRSFEEMRTMMKQLGGAKGMKALKQMRDMPDMSELMAGVGAGPGGVGGPGGMPRLPGMGGAPGGMPAPGGGRPKNKKAPKRKKKKRR